MTPKQSRALLTDAGGVVNENGSGGSDAPDLAGNGDPRSVVRAARLLLIDVQLGALMGRAARARDAVLLSLTSCLFQVGTIAFIGFDSRWGGGSGHVALILFALGCTSLGAAVVNSLIEASRVLVALGTDAVASARLAEAIAGGGAPEGLNQARSSLLSCHRPSRSIGAGLSQVPPPSAIPGPRDGSGAAGDGGGYQGCRRARSLGCRGGRRCLGRVGPRPSWRPSPGCLVDWRWKGGRRAASRDNASGETKAPQRGHKSLKDSYRPPLMAACRARA